YRDRPAERPFIRSVAEKLLKAARQIAETLKDPSDLANYNVLAALDASDPVEHLDGSSGYTTAQIAALNHWVDVLADLMPYLTRWRVSIDRMSGAIQLHEVQADADYWVDQQRAQAQADAATAAALITNSLIPAMAAVESAFAGGGTHTLASGPVAMSDVVAMLGNTG